MLRACLAGCATALLAACPTPRVLSREIRDQRLVRAHIANLEAARDHGQVELAGLVRDGEQDTSVLALRGLARVDTAEAGRALVAFAGGADGLAAASAIGLASALDEPGLEVTALRTDALLAAYRTDADHRGAILEALGRAADLRAMPVLSVALGSTDATVAATAGIALGRFGRRKLALDGVARGALITATRSHDRDVRFGATYALRQEAQPPQVHDDATIAALAARLADDDPEVRAQAILALDKRNEIDGARPALEQALRDRDWRVAVEAARALGGEHGGEAGHAAVIASVPRWLAELANDARSEHVVMAALRALTNNGAPAATFVPMLRALVVPREAPPITRGWITCMVVAARARQHDATLADVASCGAGELPDHLRLPLVGELIVQGADDAATRRTALAALLAHADARVRAAGIGALVGVWKDGTAEDHHATIATLTAAIGSPDAIVENAAIEQVPVIAKVAEASELADLDAAIVARATEDTDPELGAALLTLIGTRKLAAGAAACRAALTGHRVRVKAGETCLHELGEAVPAQTTPALATPPHLDLMTVLGKTVRWHLVTSRGEIVIELLPDVAPWAVASIVALTQKGFYDHLEFHRVVADFVAQGGDPTATGEGGPGYTLPAEPSTSEDGAGFATGGVGLADGGPDSAGSQFFIMHARAPHLDGRYTWVGRVESGQKSADSLVIGDIVERATVEISTPQQPGP